MKQRQQRGSVLIVSMVLLLVMTLIGMAGIEVTSLEEKMVFNLRDRQVAFEAAEAALLSAEEYLQLDTGDTSIIQFEGGSGGLYSVEQSDSCNDSPSSDSDEDDSPGNSGNSGNSSNEDDNESSETVDSIALAKKDWDVGCRIEFSSLQPDAFTKQAPNFIVEELLVDELSPSLKVGEVSDRYVYYRVTTSAQGLTGSSEVRVQTVYKVYRK